MDLLRRDVESHARSITALVEEQRAIREVLNELKTDRAVRRERDKNMNEKFDHLYQELDSIKGLGKWLLSAVLGAVVVQVVTFLLNGGLTGVPLP